MAKKDYGFKIGDEVIFNDGNVLYNIFYYLLLLL